MAGAALEEITIRGAVLNPLTSQTPAVLVDTVAGDPFFSYLHIERLRN